MLKNLIRLSDGTEISSGSGKVYAIQNCTITECVNGGTELTIGSACCSCLEAKIIAPDTGLTLSAGQEVELYKVDDAGNKTPMGPFTLELPTKASANTYKITAYDRVSWLDKDLSAWLKSLTGWPYTLLTFAGMVCAACGLKLATTYIPNGSFSVREFYKAGVTGRQLMQWIGEICCRFCRADANGDIELAWYTDSGAEIRPTGSRYYFSGALSYEDYEVAGIDAVQLRLADSDSGALWPDVQADNPYVITRNAILLAQVTEGLLTHMEVIQKELATMPVYRPCKVSLPASMDIRAGHTVRIVDKNGVSFTTCIMTKTQAGQRDTLECTGSARRDSPTAANNKTSQQLAAEQRAYADSAAKNAVNAQTQEEIFNKLTNNGQIQGIYAQDGKWYINAELATIVNLIADHVKSVSGDSTLEITGAFLKLFSASNETFGLYNMDGTPIMYMAEFVDGERLDGSELSPHHLKLGGTSAKPILGVSTVNGKVTMQLNAETESKTLSWKNNGDGTYTLIGS